MKSIIIGIAGGTGSGKSTFTNRIRDTFPDQTSVIYHDNYYKAQDDIPFEERVKQNYDHPDAIETDLLVRQLDQLMQGQTIESPVYDYTIHTRSKETVAVEPRPVILLEGILVLSDIRLRERMDIKIYVEADADERILRRVMRDVNERGRDLEGIVNQYLNTVKPMHYIYVEPTRAMADIVINSGMNDVAYDIVCSKIRSILAENEA
jgi:uridine kinase